MVGAVLQACLCRTLSSCNGTFMAALVTNGLSTKFTDVRQTVNIVNFRAG